MPKHQNAHENRWQRGIIILYAGLIGNDEGANVLTKTTTLNQSSQLLFEIKTTYNVFSLTARHTRVDKSLDQNIRTWTCELTREPAELVLGDLYCRLQTIKQVFHQVHNASLFCSFSRFDRIFLHYLNENDTSIIVHGNHHEQWLPQQIRKFFFIPLILVTFFQVRQICLGNVSLMNIFPVT